VVLASERGREALVVGLDRDVHPGPQRFDELVGLARLRAVLTLEGERHPDDDLLGGLGPDQLEDALEPRLAARVLDNSDRPGDRPARVRDRDARPLASVVDREHLRAHFGMALRRLAAMDECEARTQAVRVFANTGAAE